jgi:hypothetical protein
MAGSSGALGERGETGDHHAVDPERRDPVGDALLSLGEDLEDRPAHLLERGALRLVNGAQVRVDLLSGHGHTLPDRGFTVEPMPDLIDYERRGDLSAPFELTKKHERAQKQAVSIRESVRCDIPTTNLGGLRRRRALSGLRSPISGR